MRTIVQDLRYGTRVISRQPGLSLIIVVTLGLAIGANTVIFSFTNVLVVRPLPVRDQSTLGFLLMTDPQRGHDRALVSVPDLLDYRDSVGTVEHIAGTSTGTYTMTGRGDALPVSAGRVTANLFETWGVAAVAGRGFLPGEDLPGAAPVVVVSHRFWQRQFGADPGILGDHLMLNGVSHEVVGILAPEIEIGNLSAIDVWTTVTMDPLAPRDRRTLRASARLRPGVTIAQADAEFRAVSQRLQQDHPDTNAGWIARLVSSREGMTGPDTYLILGLLMLAVGFVLLIACANIANLVLAKATGRRREMAVRTALGASRARMVRQILTENLMLGLVGGALGLGLARGGLAIIKAAAHEPFFELVVIDRNVLVFTASLALLTPLVFALLPAVHSARADVNDALKDGGARAGGGVRGRRSRAALVVSQLTLAVALLVVSNLVVQSMLALTRVDWGFEPAGVLSFRVEAPEWRYANDAAVAGFYDRVLQRFAALPGVQSVAVTDRVPVLGGESTVPLTVDGHDPVRPEDRPWAVPTHASSDFFRTAGIPLLAGRGFEPRDTRDSQPVAVVGLEAARRYWGGAEQAIGGRIRIEGDSREWITVTGVAGDIRNPNLLGQSPQVYLPVEQSMKRGMSMLARAADPEGLMAAARAEMRAIDAEVAVHQLRTLEQAFEEETASSTILAGMFVAFSLLALALAATGLYGVISYSVSQRTREIGIRMALGAMTADIRRMIARQTLALVAIGCALGLAGGAALSRLATSVLYQVSASDPATYIGVVVILAAVGTFAAWAPARRAARIDPARSLRG
jgi:putative ABC transport system permease protein